MGVNVQWKWQSIIEMLEKKPKAEKDLDTFKHPIQPHEI